MRSHVNASAKKKNIHERSQVTTARYLQDQNIVLFKVHPLVKLILRSILSHWLYHCLQQKSNWTESRGDMSSECNQAMSEEDSSSKKPFRLLDLPPELRNKIYMHIAPEAFLRPANKGTFFS